MAVIGSVLGPALVGEDPFAIEAAHRKMDLAIKGYPYAKTALDEALHDIKGKALGVPVYELLGGLYREEIPLAHTSDGWSTTRRRRRRPRRSPRGSARSRSRSAADGLRREDRPRGPRPSETMSTSSWTRTRDGPRRSTPSGILRQMQEERIRYAEQPVEGLARMAQVTRVVDVPIMADESAWTPQDVLEIVERARRGHDLALHHQAGWAVQGEEGRRRRGGRGAPAQRERLARDGGRQRRQPPPGRVHGGGDGGRRLPGHDARARTSPPQMAGKMYLDDIVTRPFEYRDGYLVVPTRPGLGRRARHGARSPSTGRRGSGAMSIRSVAVLGAGNGGCAAAADLGAAGFEVRLFNRLARAARAPHRAGRPGAAWVPPAKGSSSSP